MSLRWGKAARTELEEAVQWYEAQLPELGDKLLAEILAASVLIEQFPSAWHPLSKRARSHRLNRFPYSLIDTCRAEDDIRIVALAHQHRRPFYWRNRWSVQP
ncbi:MAG: type II toxin-antitoxin system RelE/ParE family toxin [Betaproteobacteria bacterium]